MKKLMCYVIIICTLLSATGCQYFVERQKNQYLEIYKNEENYVSFTGTVTSVDNREHAQIITIDCDDLLNYVSEEKYERVFYRVFSNLPLSLEVGDIITFVTTPNQFEYRQTRYDNCLPIVSIDKNGEIILDLKEGKENLYAWVNQLGIK